MINVVCKNLFHGTVQGCSLKPMSCKNDFYMKIAPSFNKPEGLLALLRNECQCGIMGRTDSI